MVYLQDRQKYHTKVCWNRTDIGSIAQRWDKTHSLNLSNLITCFQKIKKYSAGSRVSHYNNKKCPGHNPNLLEIQRNIRIWLLKSEDKKNLEGSHRKVTLHIGKQSMTRDLSSETMQAIFIKCWKKISAQNSFFNENIPQEGRKKDILRWRKPERSLQD